MELSSVRSVVVLLCLLGCSAFFACAEVAFFTLGSYRVRRIREKASKSFKAARELLHDPALLISSVLIGNEVVNAGVSVIGSSLVFSYFRGRVHDDWLPVLATAIVLPVIVVFGEVVPKTLGVRDPEFFVRFTARPLRFLARLVTPVRAVVAFFTQLILWDWNRNQGNVDTVSEEVFRSMIDAGTKEGVLDATESQLIQNVFKLDTRRVREIMQPKERVFAVDSKMRIDEVISLVDKERYSRFPVLDASKQKILGVLYTKDLLGIAPENRGDSVRTYMRSPLLVSGELNAFELFTQFRSRRTHFAVVVNGGGREEMQGVVTLENVLEEIFGSIRDESDVEGAEA